MEVKLKVNNLEVKWYNGYLLDVTLSNQSKAKRKTNWER